MSYGIKYSCEQGDIVLVPFPFTDLSAKKRRPVLVLSNNTYNKTNSDFICCGITSKTDDKNYSVLIDTEDLTSGFLPQPSKIKTNKIATLEQSLIIKTIAKVNEKTIKEVKDKLIKLFS